MADQSAEWIRTLRLGLIVSMGLLSGSATSAIASTPPQTLAPIAEAAALAAEPIETVHLTERWQPMQPTKLDSPTVEELTLEELTLEELTAAGAMANQPTANQPTASQPIAEQAIAENTPAPTVTPAPTDTETDDSVTPLDAGEPVELDPAILENSPVLQRWIEEVPDVLSEIRRDPSFRTRLRVGYSQFPANEQAAGFNLGVEDVFLGRSGLTLSGNYQRSFSGERETYGGDLHYYVLPLGSSINFAPVVGYRHIDTDRDTSDGINLGARLRIIPSRTGAADITLTQSWVAPGTNEEVGISTLSFGYAVTRNLRIATDLEKQNAPIRKDSRVAIVLEWML